MTREQDYSNTVFRYPAAVLRTRATQDELRRLVVERQILDEAAVEQYQPYFFPAEISNNRLDSHYTRMAVSSLKNYAADAEAGVSFLYSHDIEELIGRSMGGRFVGGQGDGIARVVADFYTIPGLQLGTVSSDQIIRAIDAKILKDVSIGFFGGQWICSICGRDMWSDWDCWHIPSISYEIEGDGKVREEVCTATVEDAHLAETSGVYKGSTPSAVITKAQQESERGRIKPDVRLSVERRFHVTLPAKRVSAPGHSSNGERQMSQRRDNEGGGATDPPVEQDPPVDQSEQDPPVENPPPVDPPAPPPPTEPPSSEGEGEPIAVDEATRQLPNVRALLVEAGAPDRGDLLTRIRFLVERARDGVSYREALITEALVEGARALGTDFDREARRRALEGYPTELVKQMRDDWARIAKGTFPGGRQTTEGDEQPANSVRGETVTDEAYAGV